MRLRRVLLGAALAGAAVTADPLRGQCTSEPEVEIIGTGSLGTNGFAALNSVRPVVGLPYELQMTNGLAGSAGQLLGSFALQPLYLSFYNATLYPALPAGQSFTVPFVLDPNGKSGAILPLNPTPAVLCGFDLYLQAAYVDAGATNSVAFSDALRVRFGRNASPLVDPLPRITNQLQITVSGTSVEPQSTIDIQGGAAAVRVSAVAGSFSATVALKANAVNPLAVTEELTGGGRSPAVFFDVTQDSSGPDVIIGFPSDHARVATPSTTVSGTVRDLLSGLPGLTVTVNGQAASVDPSTGSFSIPSVALSAGAATAVMATATDALGNQSQSQITVTHTPPPPGSGIAVLSGNQQSATVGSELPQQIAVRVVDAGSAPLVGELMTFRVTASNGTLSDQSGGGSAAVLQAFTDANGEARAFWTLGSDAGQNNNRVEVTNPAFTGRADFFASASAGSPVGIDVGSGQLQATGPQSDALELLRARVTDGANGVAGVPVTFTVTQGDGVLSTPGNRENTRQLTVSTVGTGHAEVSFTAGTELGLNRVEATYAGNPRDPVEFTVRVLTDQRFDTSFVGLVTDNSEQPIGGVRVDLQVGTDPPLQAITDAEGQFAFTGLTTDGPADLNVDGATANMVGKAPVPAGTRFPSLHYETYVALNTENQLLVPINLPRLDSRNDRSFDGNRDVDLTIVGLEGVRFRVRAGTTVTLPNGTVASPATPVTLSLNQVQTSDIPMPLPDGSQPPFAWTMQPADTTFDPPVDIELPNLSGLPPGAVTDLLSFNHQVGEFEVAATGRVSDDGTRIVSDPGQGIRTSGWGAWRFRFTCTSTVKIDPRAATQQQFTDHLTARSGSPGVGLARFLDCMAQDALGSTRVETRYWLRDIADRLQRPSGAALTFEREEDFTARIPTWLSGWSRENDLPFVFSSLSHSYHEMYAALSKLIVVCFPLPAVQVDALATAAMTPCLTAPPDLSADTAAIAEISLPEAANRLARYLTPLWVQNISSTPNGCDNFNFPPLPTALTKPELEQTLSGLGLTVRISGSPAQFFLNAGSSQQLEVLRGATDVTATSRFFVVAPQEVARVDVAPTLDVLATSSPLPTARPVVWVIAEEGGDFGIGQFAIQDVDSDGDHIADSYEQLVGLNPSAANAINCDSDLDEIPDLLECLIGTHPLLADTDGDSFPDGREIKQNSDPLNASSQDARLGWGCTVECRGQRTPVNVDGSFRLPDVNFSCFAPFLVRASSTVRATCAVGPITYVGTSPRFTLVDGRDVCINEFPLLQTPQPDVVGLSITSNRAVLDPANPIAQLSVTALLSDGRLIDVTGDPATDYSWSPALPLSSVSSTGMVTASSDNGSALIMVSHNDGPVATIEIRNQVNPQFGSIIGTVVRGGAGQPGASVTLLENPGLGSVTAGFVPPGRFQFGYAQVDPFPSLQARGTFSSGGMSFEGFSAPAVPVPSGVTDVGDVILREIVTQVLVTHDRSGLPCFYGGASTLSVLDPSTAGTAGSLVLLADACDVATSPNGARAVASSACTPQLWFVDMTGPTPVSAGVVTVPIQCAQLEVTSTGYALVLSSSLAGSTLLSSVDLAGQSLVSTVTLPEPINLAAASPDGSFALVGSRSSSTLRVVDISPTGQLSLTTQTPTNPSGPSAWLCFRPDGRQAVCANRDNSITVYDVASGVVAYRSNVVVASQPMMTCESALFSPDGAQLYVLVVTPAGRGDLHFVSIDASGDYCWNPPTCGESVGLGLAAPLAFGLNAISNRMDLSNSGQFVVVGRNDLGGNTRVDIVDVTSGPSYLVTPTTLTGPFLGLRRRGF
ncbi:MAG: hypothetical protein AAF628_31905 [Planctomycetota bacterium]